MTKQKDLDVLDEGVVQTILSKVSPQFEIVDGNLYYLYARTDGSYFISLIEPEYWDLKRFKITFVDSVVHFQGEGWKPKKEKNDS